MVLNYIDIPKEILQLHKTVPVVAWIILFNGLAFLVSISRHVKFDTVQYLGKSMMDNISKYLENINDVYYIRVMYVEKFYVDGEF